MCCSLPDCCVTGSMSECPRNSEAWHTVNKCAFVNFIGFPPPPIQVGFCWAPHSISTRTVSLRCCQNGSNPAKPSVSACGTTWRAGQEKRGKNLNYTSWVSERGWGGMLLLILFSFLTDFLRKCEQMSFRLESPASLCKNDLCQR